jgi:hypothetical protein
MTITITIAGMSRELTDEECWALRAACGAEHNACKERERSTKTRHLRDRWARQAAFLRTLANYARRESR